MAVELQNANDADLTLFLLEEPEALCIPSFN